MSSRDIAVIVASLPSTSRPSGCSGKSALREQIVHEIVGRVVAHPDLFEDDLALGLDVVGAERGAPQHVGEDVERELELRVGDPHVEHRLLVRRERVHLAADRLDRLRDLARAAVARCP